MAQEPAIRKIIRENIRNRRISLGLRQSDVADELGVVAQWVQCMESPHNAKIPSVERLVDLARVLKCQPHDLLFPQRFADGVSADVDLRKVSVR